MNKDQRKAALSAYKERKISSGIFAIRCPAAGLTWVGSAPDLSTIQNRHWFTLRQGSHPNSELQRAWSEHGGESLSFDIVARLDEDAPDIAHGRLLKDLLASWSERLLARRV